ncbi:16759_t:CDS:2 [Gigaspora margarita]|uniref:16759_t:CDS:1 n=1 Tax=Gigaspora margarita TaxID=4874 RepID=A0ABM8VX88_GIGMA|nr:16759_t:CDS:2 [Gigaspora margarita]
MLLLTRPMLISQNYIEIKTLLDKVKDNKHATSETSNNITLVLEKKIISELMLKPDHNFVQLPDIIEIWNAKTRNKLIKIINYALDAYIKREYQKFINILSEEYKTDDIFAKNIFQEVMNKDLVKNTEKLDDTGRNFVYDAQKMLFVSRLEEICNIARINIVTLELLTPGPNAIEQSIKIFNEIRISTYFEHLAENDYKINRLNRLRNLNSAQNNYENAREIDPKNIFSALGYTECLLKLSKYTQIIELNKASPFLTFHQTLRLDPKNKLANKQISFLKKLRNENLNKHCNNQYKKEKIYMKYEQDNFLNSRSNENTVYNLLSIDEEANSQSVYLFACNNAHNDELKNYTFVNTLMAATSIPTFSSPYEIKHKGLFLDGGSYIPNPSNPVHYRDQLFWPSNQFNLLYDENEIDHQMYAMLENKYQRWQVSFEEPIKLDALEKIPYLIEIGHQYLEELYDSDENPINKLIEYFKIGGMIVSNHIYQIICRWIFEYY